MVKQAVGSEQLFFADDRVRQSEGRNGGNQRIARQGDGFARQPAPARRLKDGEQPLRQAHQLRTDLVGSIGAAGADRHAHAAHVPAAGAVAFDAVDCIDKGEIRLHRFAQVDQRVGKTVQRWPPTVPFRLLQPRNAAEQVFHPGGHHGQPMGLELGAVDDVIGLQHGREQVEAAAAAIAHILVEGEQLGQRSQPAGLVQCTQGGGRIRPAGAVGQRDVLHAVRAQPARHARQQRRMGGDGACGIARGQQIGLEQHAHAGFEIFRHAQRLKMRGDGFVYESILIPGNGPERDQRQGSVPP